MKIRLVSKLAGIAVAATIMMSAGSALAKNSHSSPPKPPRQSGGHSVPDGGATALLVGLGVGAVALAGRKFKK